jgi:hypothetical protein
MPKPIEIDPVIMKAIYEERFKGDPSEDPIAHLKRFEKRCDFIKLDNVSNERIKIKTFPYSLAERSLYCSLDFPLGTFHSWHNIKAAFMEIFGLPSIMSYNIEVIFSFKQQSNE